MNTALLRRATLWFAIAPPYFAGGCSNSPPHQAVDAADSSSPQACNADIIHTLAPDPDAMGETYLCYGFDARSLVQQTIEGLLWNAPASGGVVWHHATLSAVPGDFPDGPIPCDGMPPGSTSLHVWAPGGDNLLLPEATGLELPETTMRLVVELHVLRASSASAGTGSLGICFNHEPVRNRARFFGVAAGIPALRPHTKETSSTKCTFAASTHLWSVWPHMHRLGTAIEAVLVRGTGERELLRRVEPWDFTKQRTYPLAVDLAAGDRLESTCWWNNETNEYVFGGLRTTDEMCNQGFIGWPETSLSCE